MNRANMAKQITEVPMAGCKSKMKKGGKVMAQKKMKKGYMKGGKVDQTACSPRKRAAMGKA